MSDDYDMPQVPVPMSAFNTTPVQEDPKEPAPAAVATEGWHEQGQTPAMPVREILNRTMLAEVLNELADRVDDDMDKSCAKMQKTALAITESVQALLDAAVAQAKAEVHGAATEAAEVMGQQAGEIVMKLLAEEAGNFAAALAGHTDTMLTAANQMQKAAAKAPSAPSRFVWLVIGAVGFWAVTKYVDLGRWVAIGNAVLKNIQGVAA